jgi:hypothetical protein
VSSSNLAVFSESKLRIISDQLGHNETRDLIGEVTRHIDSLGHRGMDQIDVTIWARISSSTVPHVDVAAEEAASYISAYFEHVHPVYPFLDRKDFEQMASDANLAGKLDSRPAFSALYHAVLALGCQYVGDCPFDSRGKPWQLFHVSLKLLPHILLPPDSLVDLQVGLSHT